MKTIITLIGLMLIVLSSCNETTVTKVDLPTEIATLSSLNKYDTVYTINTDVKVFVFNSKKEYIGAYIKKDSSLLLWCLGLITGALVMFILPKI